MKKAFTLMETVVAIAIFGMSVSVLMMAMGNLMNGLNTTGDCSKENFIKEFCARELLAMKSLREAAHGGSFSAPDDTKITWSAQITPATALDLYEVILDLEYEHDRSATKTSTHLLAYKPEWSHPANRTSQLEKLKNAIEADRQR